MEQAAEHESSGDARDSPAKPRSIEPATHPFPAMRAGQARPWIDDGEY